MKGKRLVVGIVLLVSFLYLVFSVSTMLGVGVHDDACSAIEGCPHEQALNLLTSGLPLLLSLAVVAGAGTYYFMSEKVESSQKTAQKTAGVVLKFLDGSERKVVDLLVRNRGKMLQSEISHLDGYTKVKAHRIIRTLSDRGVIEVQRNGKTNILRFAPALEHSMLEVGE